MSTFVTDRAGHRTVHRFLLYSAFFSQSNLPVYLVALDGKPPREVLSGVLVLTGQGNGPNCSGDGILGIMRGLCSANNASRWIGILDCASGRRTERQVGTCSGSGKADQRSGD